MHQQLQHGSLLGSVTGPGSLAQVMGSSLAILVRKKNFSFHQPAWVMGDG
jgi:hypothetical protein